MQRSNENPSAKDKNEQSELARIARLDALRTEISVLKLSLEKAQREFEELEIQPRREHNYNLSINRLPDEMVAEIFEQSVAVALHPEQILAAIGAVCSVWRHVALTTPTLWTRINYLYSFDSEALPSLERVEAYLSRSKGAELDLRIRVERSITTGIFRFINVIYQHLHRCHSIDIAVSSFDAAHQFLPLPGKLPALRHLSVDLFGQYIPEQEEEDLMYMGPEIWLLHDHNCRPRSLTLKATPGYEVVLYGFDRSKITHLDILSPALFDSLEFIGECSNVESLILTFLPGFVMPTAEILQSTDIRLPYLTSLHIRGLSSTMRTLHAFSAPNLQHLSLLPIYDDDPDGLDEVLSIGERRGAFPLLRTLSIMNDIPTPNILSQFISARPHLVALAFQCLPGIVEVLRSLAPLTSTPPSSPSNSKNDLTDFDLNQLRLIRLDWNPIAGVGIDPMANTLRSLLKRCKDVRIEWETHSKVLPLKIKRLRALYPRRIVYLPAHSGSELETLFPAVAKEPGTGGLK